jgi:Domain of unknown function (DUF1929)
LTFSETWQVLAPRSLARLYSAITNAPAEVPLGQPFVVETPDAGDIASAALIRQSSTTHQINSDQRYVGPAILDKGRGHLNVQAPLVVVTHALPLQSLVAIPPGQAETVVLSPELGKEPGVDVAGIEFIADTAGELDTYHLNTNTNDNSAGEITQAS